MLVETGYTYAHEHLHLDLSPQKSELDCRHDQAALIMAEMHDLYQRGVHNIVDVTNSSMGRNIPFIEKLEQETGMNVILSTGYYIEGFYPPEVYHLSVPELAQKMVDELTVGIAGTQRKAQIIGEIGTGLDRIHPSEEKVFAAAAIAQRELQVPVSTHTSLSTMALEQVALMKKLGFMLENVTMGHCDLRDDLDIILRLIDTGVHVQFDTIGKNSYFPDQRRAEMLVSLAKRGVLDRVMLSMDITRRSHLKQNGGLGYHYLIDSFLPMLKAQGLTESEITQLMQTNPINFFNNKKSGY